MLLFLKTRSVENIQDTGTVVGTARNYVLCFVSPTLGVYLIISQGIRKWPLQCQKAAAEKESEKSFLQGHLY